MTKEEREQIKLEKVRLKEQKRAEKEKIKENKRELQALRVYIIEKYVKKDRISWPRDLKIANILISRYPEREFWEQTPGSFQVNALVQLNTVKCQNFYDWKYKEWKLNNRTKEVYQPEVFRKFETNGVDNLNFENSSVDKSNVATISKPKSVLDFCK